MERQELERLWRSRLRDAEIRLDFAVNFLQEVQRDFPHPFRDGRDAYQNALRAQKAAVADFKRVLRFFTDFVIDGKIPDEEEWQKYKAAAAGVADA